MNRDIDVIKSVAKVYGHEASIKRMEIHRNKKRNLQIDATLFLHGQENHCTFSLDTKDRLIQPACDCKWFSMYHHCPHIQLAKETAKEFAQGELPVEVSNPQILELEENFATYEERCKLRHLQRNAVQSKQLLETFMNRYESHLKLDINEIAYEIEPVFSDDLEAWNLSFKVGAKKKYVIKSINTFLKQVDQHVEVSYGKNLTFVHSASAFDDFSQETLRFMRKYLQIQQQHNPDCNLRAFPLEGFALDEFYELYEESTFDSFHMCDDELQLHIEVRQENEYTIFHAEELEAYHFGEKHIYTCESFDKMNLIHRYPLDDEGITALFLKQLSSKNIVVSKEDYPSYYKYVLLNVMRFVDMELPSTLSQEGMDHAELYGDIDENNQIYFYLYCYDTANIRYFGFDSQRLISYEQELIESYIKKYATSIDEQKHFIYMDENHEATLDFIQDGLPYLSEYCDIYVSEALKSLGKSHSYQIQVGVKFSNHLLELDINSLEIPKEELGQVLNAYKRRKKFYRLRNGKLLSLKSDDLQQLDTFMNDYHLSVNDLQKKKIQMEPYRMFSLQEKSQDKDTLKIIRADSFIKQIETYYHKHEHPIPAHYKSILRDYQITGFQWLSTLRDYHFNGILADDMGLGKTLQVIALLEANKGNHTSLVICPASLIYNWEEEVHKFANDLSILCITGTQDERKVRISQYTNYDVLVTSYDYIKRDIECYSNIVFDTVILDEAQYIKNQKTKNAICVKRLQTMHRLALTGTPIENTLAELWSIFDFLMPEYLFNYHYFQKQFETEIVKNQNEEKQEELRKLVTPFILRRNKKDVLKELPDKIENVRLIEFNDEERKLYQAHLALINKELQGMETVGSKKIEILALLTKLRQICCEPRVLFMNIHQMSSKLTECVTLLQELHENHQKTLVFSSFTSMLDLLAEELKRKQIPYYILNGSVNKEKRQHLVEQFQNDDTSVFLISLKAGGTGLNLTAAEAVIHFDPWWNQSAQNQATDRAYRIGQQRNVQVFKFIMKNSIEEKIMKMQEQKKALADAFVENNDGSISHMSKEELMELLTM